jgi:3'-phosphoadenosine 5'-phosphosulfate sulfotransferase (PAPS reductase)/FAD synthetase
MGKNILALSGGKDSTALALVCAEDGLDFELFFTPTFRELPECIDHIARVKEMTGKPLVVRKSDLTLEELIVAQRALPNSNMRWCTRITKIEPAKAYLLANPGSTLLVGLRADEPEREGMWGEFAEYRYPLREKGWGIKEVYAYLDARGVSVPDGLRFLLRPTARRVVAAVARPPRAVRSGRGAGGADRAHVPLGQPRHLAGGAEGIA